jgi:hypothetical protein
LTIDPWALAEGCVRESEGFVEYALAWDRPAPASVDVVAIGAPFEGAIEVEIDRVPLGTFDGTAFHPIDGAIARAFREPAPYRWLRLTASNAGGAAALRRFTRDLPADGLLILETTELPGP